MLITYEFRNLPGARIHMLLMKLQNDLTDFLANYCHPFLAFHPTFRIPSSRDLLTELSEVMIKNVTCISHFAGDGIHSRNLLLTCQYFSKPLFNTCIINALTIARNDISTKVWKMPT